MKKNFLLIFCLVASCIASAQIINFPDANLKAKLLSATPSNGVAYNLAGNMIKIDANSNGQIEISEALNVKELKLNIYILPYLHVSNLTGLNNFTNLTKLTTSANTISSLAPISNLTNLTYLDCYGSTLTSLVGIENLVNLKTLLCGSNSITSLAPISNLINLEVLSCSSNQLNSVSSLQNLTNLKNLNCSYNQINSTFGIENLVNLVSADFSVNQLTSVTPLDNLISLISLVLRQNNITSFNPIFLPSLGSLDLSDNQLTSITINNLSNLTFLFCNDNQLTFIDISGTSVYFLHCYDNPNLQTLKLKNNIITPSYNSFGVANSEKTTNPSPIPPPLPPNLWYHNCYNLNYICYDEGELPAVLDGFDTTPVPSNLTLTTDCVTFADKSTVNLKLNIQGYYDTTTNLMRPVKFDQGFSTNPLDVEDVVVELRNNSGTLIASKTTVLKRDGTAVCEFPNRPTGAYYVGIKSKNVICVWSATPLTIGATPLTYDFSNSASKAFGNNLVQLSNGVFGLYSGDINNDGNVDNSDYSNWEIDANNFAFGFYATDLNGDGNVDNSDFSIWETNNNNFIYSVTPFP